MSFTPGIGRPLDEFLSAERFAAAFTRIRGAHNGEDHDPREQPCDWCQLAGEQAAEAVRVIFAARIDDAIANDMRPEMPRSPAALADQEEETP